MNFSALLNLAVEGCIL